jgi:hypothetical protein
VSTVTQKKRLPFATAFPSLTHPSKKKDGTVFLFYLILLLYSLADQFSTSNYYRNGGIRIGNDKRGIPNLLLLLFYFSLSFPPIYFLLFSTISLTIFISFSFSLFIQPPVQINNRKSRQDCGACNPEQSEHDINL